MVTGDPAWKHFEKVSREADLREQHRLDADHFRCFVLPVLQLIEEADCYGELMWKVNPRIYRVTFQVMCSDTFAYACADAEPLETMTDLARLNRAYRELRKLERDYPGSIAVAFLPELYAARRRKMQPLPAWLSGVCRDEYVRELFEELPPNPITLMKGEPDEHNLREVDASAVPETGSPGEVEGVPGAGNGEAGPGSVL